MTLHPLVIMATRSFWLGFGTHPPGRRHIQLLRRASSHRIHYDHQSEYRQRSRRVVAVVGEQPAKSQEEWIQDGFATVDIHVSLPPTEADVIPLLELLGTEDVDGTWGYSTSLKYNAFRWLRDSDFNFDPMDFVFTHSTDAARPEIQAGLLEYRKHERRHPNRETAGRLYFGTVTDWYDDWDYLSWIAYPVFKQRMNALIVGLFVLATALILCTVKVPRRNTTDV
jgi:hypothetical protein